MAHFLNRKDNKTMEFDEELLTQAHLAIEDVLIELRDARVSVLGRANGFIIREKDGSPSLIMRLGTRDGLRIAIKAYLKAANERRQNNATD